MKTAFLSQLKQSHTFFASAFFDNEKNERYECSTCHKRFNRPSALRTHNFTHSGEKPFACDVQGCGRRFSVVSNLRRHSKVHNRTPSMQRTRLSSNERNRFLQRLIDSRSNQSTTNQVQSSSLDFRRQELPSSPVSRLSVQWLMNQDDGDDSAGNIQNTKS